MLNRLISSKTNQIYKTQGLDGKPWSKSFGDPEFEMFIQYVAPEDVREITIYEKFPP